jgi:hypothetical protein
VLQEAGFLGKSGHEWPLLLPRSGRSHRRSEIHAAHSTAATTAPMVVRSSFFGASAAIASVVIIRPAIDAAFCSA